MQPSTIGIICLVVGVFAFGIGLLRPRTGMKAILRWRSLIGGIVAIVLGILLLTGVIGG